MIAGMSILQTTSLDMTNRWSHVVSRSAATPQRGATRALIVLLAISTVIKAKQCHRNEITTSLG